MIWDFNSYKDKTALIDDAGNTLTYSELEKKSCELYDLSEGRSLVFILCTNSIGSVVGYTACLNKGLVPLLINSNLEKELLDNLIFSYWPRYLWLPDERVTDFSDLKVVYKTNGYSLLVTNYSNEYTMHNDLALLLTTSGSTGSPKFVRQSYDNIRSNTESIVDYLELDYTERAITTLPMNYTYGLSIINTHLFVGATVLLTDKGILQKEFWKFFKDKEATSFGGVPYTYEMLDKLRFYRMELPHLRTFTQAGGKLTPELHKKFAEYAVEKGKKFIVMYGQCEATARMGYLPADLAIKKTGSMGISIPGGRFRLVDIEGNDIDDPFITGELVYEGKNVTMGYAENKDDLSKGDERKGVLITGDMAQFDEDHFYYIVGRKKRFLKIYGNRVNLDEMDRLIRSRFDIEVACAGKDDHLYIFITDSGLADSVKDYAASVTKLNLTAFNIVVLEAIPKNDAGKTLYKDLEQYYEF